MATTMLLGAVLALLVWTAFAFNRLVRRGNLVREAWSGIDVQLTRRLDLVPNLVEVVQSYASFEKQLLSDVTRLRAEGRASRALQDQENALSDRLRGVCWPSPRPIRSCWPTRTSCACRNSWPRSKTSCRWRAATTTAPCATTTRPSSPFPCTTARGSHAPRCRSTWSRSPAWWVFITAFALPFFAGEVFGLFFLVQTTSFWMGPVLVVLIGVNFIFFYLLKQPTLAGRKVMDQIDGFKMYLTTAEGPELAQAAPAKTPQLYERLLPYAIALGVENRWAEQFSDVLRAAAQDAGAAGGGGGSYHPSWYSGNSLDGM